MRAFHRGIHTRPEPLWPSGGPKCHVTSTASLVQLTKAGRSFLKDHLHAAVIRALEEPPSDTESVLRIAFLAQRRGARRQAKDILAAAAVDREQRAAAVYQELSGKRPFKGEAKYLRWLRSCEVARLSAEAKVLRTLSI